MQVHRDIMDGRYSMPPFNGEPGMVWVSPSARVDASARLEGPLFVDEGCVVKAGARLGPYTVLGKNSQVEEDANISGAIVWAETRIGREATVTNTIIGRSGQIGSHARLNGGVLGDCTSIADYSRL
jgi:NDP-sugar pyrophosphorylase family protein